MAWFSIFKEVTVIQDPLVREWRNIAIEAIAESFKASDLTTRALRLVGDWRDLATEEVRKVRIWKAYAEGLEQAYLGLMDEAVEQLGELGFDLGCTCERCKGIYEAMNPYQELYDLLREKWEVPEPEKE